ncbi:sialidase-1-like [Sycon ciliatum]|uniref:sialidase-1-like n=1 Tax=Sycon ciliatum TaxID=27933 RepID=UPI0031F64D6F
MKRSEDMGKTWSKLMNVYGLNVSDIVAGNQIVVVNDETGAVMCIYSTSPAGKSCSPASANWQTVSYDAGDHWSTPVDISKFLEPYAGVSSGPGDGLQLTQGKKKGRLVFAGHYGAYREDIVWYSDDSGLHYTRPNVTFPKMDEATLTQLANGSILLNMRNAHASSCDCRATSRSDDAGETWTPIRYDPTLISPICQASLAQIESRLYFSNPASTKSRENLTVRVSDDGGTTWIKKTLLVQGGSVWGGYSSLVPDEIGTGLGGVLYERYSNGKQAISFSAFPLDFDKM